MSAQQEQAPVTPAEIDPPFDNPQPAKAIDGKVRARQLRDQALRDLIENGVIS